MNKIITNTKKEVSSGIDLNEKDYLTHFLCMLKDLEKNMAIALTEASNEKLYEAYKKMFDTISEFQRQAYELMFKYGWYSMETVSETKIDTVLKNLSTELDSLNN